MTGQQLRDARRKEARQAKTKVCRVCGEEKTRDEFYTRKTTVDGLYGECKICHVNKSTSKGKDRSAYRKSAKGMAQYLVSAARKRARQKDIPFLITIEWVEEKLNNGVCEVTRIPLVITMGGRGPYTPSLDQKNAGAGYTEENTQLVCWIYNAAKGAGTHDDVVILARAVIK